MKNLYKCMFIFKYPVSGELMDYVKGSRADYLEVLIYVCHFLKGVAGQ